MHILLIGATGQIGYALAHALAKTEHQLTVLVRDAARLAFPAGVRVKAADPFTAADFRAALLNVDHVIYGVGLPEQFLLDETTFQRVNYGLLEAFLSVLQETAVPRLTYISTYETFAAIDNKIRESHPIASESDKTAYFATMIRAYKMVLAFADAADVVVTTIHPAAVYGGLNTGQGFTNYIENLRHKRIAQAPTVFDGRFPLVHADSLADGIIRALDHPGAFIFSDGMSSLPEMARLVKAYTNSYMPPTVPLWLVRLSAVPIEWLARLTRRTPIMARVQIEFVTKGWEPLPERAITELGWEPRPLEDGIKTYLDA